MKKVMALIFATLVAIVTFATDSTATATPAKAKVKYHGLVDAGWSSQTDMAETLTLSREVVINKAVGLTNHEYKKMFLTLTETAICNSEQLESFIMDSCRLEKISANAEVAGIKKTGQSFKLRFSEQKLEEVLCLVEKSTGRVLVKMNCGNFVHYTLPAKVDKVDKPADSASAGAGWFHDWNLGEMILLGLVLIALAILIGSRWVRNALMNLFRNPIRVIVEGNPPVGHRTQG